ncbi:hypothetical protein BEH94_07800 [Candidatus Altiarchaeales archaeon WOR_SM1_SCG]|nr:hypothetical protein BEH94_07800 [Candidatus Altiarchaeales archaeon WOR_SM1_SCG]
MKDPEVTVLMSVYNGEKYLREAIDSILNQTFKDFEFLIVNDGSTDKTAEILKSYDDHRVKIINNKKNIGLTKSLNKGLKVARGKYIARMDADDISMHERLEREIYFLETHQDYAVVGTFLKILDEDSEVIRHLERPIKDADIREFLNNDNCIPHGSVMVRKACLLDVGFYDESIARSQDYELWLRLSEKYRLANIPEYLYAWRAHKENIESRYRSEQVGFVEMAKEKAIERRFVNILAKIKDKDRKPRISAVVCTYNRSHLLRLCLESLVNQSLDKSLYEVIVVDNNSTDDTLKVVKEFSLKYPNFRVIQEKKQGLSYARNRGYHEACGEFVAYIDNDAKADRDWVRNILRAFEAVLPQPSAVGGKILPYYLSKKPDWFLDKYVVFTWGDKVGFLKASNAKYGFYGSNMAFPKVVLEQYGGFRSDLGMVGDKMGLGEETELFYRIYKDHPYFWYDPRIKVEHLVTQLNMNIFYRLNRSFINGRISIMFERIEGIKPTFFDMTNVLKEIGIYSVKLIFRVRLWRKYWQRNFLDGAIPISRSFGRLIGMIRLNTDFSVEIEGKESNKPLFETDIAVCILFYEKLEQTIECIKSVLPSGVKIYILNNGSSSSSRKILEGFCNKYKQIKIFDSDTNLGPAAGRNYLINHTTEDWLLFLDNDTYVKTKDWLNKFYKHVSLHKHAEVFIPNLFDVHENRYVTYKSFRIEGNNAIHDVEIVDDLTNTFPGGASFVNRKVFNRLGTYDKKMFAFEEFELTIRSILKGKMIKARLIYDIELVHDHKYVKKKEDVNAVMTRYNYESIESSYNRIVEKHDIMLDGNWHIWVAKQIENVTKKSNPFVDFVWKKWVSNPLKSIVRSIIEIK